MRIKTLVSVLLLAGTACTASADISLSSLDDFSATSEGWRIGNVSTATWPTREPGTSFDGQSGYLSHFSDGAGARGKWLMWSDESDWRGNYTAAGVTAVSLWADNRAGSPLGLRVAFNGPGGWFYSDAQTITNVTAGDDWTRLVYDLAGFTHVAGGGTGIFGDTLSDVTRFEILGGSGGITRQAPRGGFLQAGVSTNTVWIDSISAVPEPSSALLLMIGCAGIAVFLKRKRDHSSKK